MKKSRFNGYKIIFLLKEYESDQTVDSNCSANGICKATFCNRKNGRMYTIQLKR